MRRLMVASGEVSVMPQPCTISTFSSSQNQRISDGGGADPPQVTRSSDDRSNRFGSVSTICLIPCQMVGTPAEMVTYSVAISSASRSGVMNRWG